MNDFSRQDVVLVWQCLDESKPTCCFCRFRKIHKEYEQINGNCPIHYGNNNCIDDIDMKQKEFSNDKCIAYATIYGCYIKKTKCVRPCSECGINHLIKKIQNNISI